MLIEQVFAKSLAAALAVTLVFATPAVAAEFRKGCYQRIYSAGHLAGHPAQVVAAIRLKVGEWQTNVSRGTKMEIVVANQGRARGTGLAGRALSQYLFCGTEGRSDICVAECDSGAIELRRQDAGGLTFRTRYLMVGNGPGCGGFVDLAEVAGRYTSYKLYRVPDAVCNGM